MTASITEPQMHKEADLLNWLCFNYLWSGTKRAIDKWIVTLSSQLLLMFGSMKCCCQEFAELIGQTDTTAVRSTNALKYRTCSHMNLRLRSGFSTTNQTPISLIADQNRKMIADQVRVVFPSPINAWSSIKSPVNLIAHYSPINWLIANQRCRTRKAF